MSKVKLSNNIRVLAGPVLWIVFRFLSIRLKSDLKLCDSIVSTSIRVKEWNCNFLGTFVEKVFGTDYDRGKLSNAL